MSGGGAAEASWQPSAPSRGQGYAHDLGHRPSGPVRGPGGSAQLTARTLAMTAVASGAVRGGRGLSRNNPSTPCVANRACPSQTAGRLAPVHRATSCAVKPLGRGPNDPGALGVL